MLKVGKKIHWWIFALIAFFVFVLLQVPAAWLIAKFHTNNQNLYHVRGNIWQGQASWKQANLVGTLTWNARPLDLLRLRLAADIEVDSGNSSLQAKVAYGLGKNIFIQNLKGEIAPETLKNMVNWQWPSSRIQLQDIQLRYKPEQGFSAVDGNLQWAGGALQYEFAQRQERMNVPVLSGKLSDEQQKLMINVQDNREQKMLNIGLDAAWMLDLQLTQRFLLNAPSYEGKAALDSYVISTRQPLLGRGQ